MSDQQGEIFKLIPKVMQDIGSVSKGRKNEEQRYMFRGIEDFYQAAHPAMIKHGIFCAPKVLNRDCYRFEKLNRDGTPRTWVHVALEVEHRFYAGDGSSVSVTTWGEGLDNSDKATNKAMSGAMKYALIELFCVPTEDVEDADRQSPEAGVQRTRVSLGTPPATTTPLPKPNGGNGAPKITEGQRTNFKTTFKRALSKDRIKDADDLYAAYLKEHKIDFDTMTPDDFYPARDEAEAHARTL